MNPRLLASGLLGAIGVHECASLWERSELRRELMHLAEARAKALHRPLIVFRPSRSTAFDRVLESWETGVFEPVDFSLVRADELGRPPIKRFGSDSAVVFVACVLEYLEDVQAAMDEILRIAGSTDNIFVVTIQPWTFFAQLNPRAKWVGISDGHVVSLGRVTGLQRGIAAGLLLGLVGVSLWPRVVPDEISGVAAVPPGKART